jgi:predicted acyl esterase
VELWPIGYRWAAGHRIRLQLAGAAWPRYARNTGTGEPLHCAVTVRRSDHEIWFGPGHPSAVLLPVAPADPTDPAQPGGSNGRAGSAEG